MEESLPSMEGSFHNPRVTQLSHTGVADRTRMRMASRKRGGDALGSAVKALLSAAGNPSTLSGTKFPSWRHHKTDDEGSYRHLEIPENERFQIYRKLPKGEHDEL